MSLILLIVLAHSWYPYYCCQDQHCHPVDCAEIHAAASGTGYYWKSIFFTKARTNISPDGACHACVSDNDEGYCLWLGGIS